MFQAITNALASFGGLFVRKPDNRLPHEKYPHILEWQIGDDLRSPNPYIVHISHGLVSIAENGTVYMQRAGCSEIVIGDIDYIAKRWTNKSLLNRARNEEIKNSGRYMELLQEFQKAVKELKGEELI